MASQVSGPAADLELTFEPASGPTCRMKAFSEERFALPYPKDDDDERATPFVAPAEPVPPASSAPQSGRMRFDHLPQEYLTRRIGEFRRRQIEQNEQSQIARAPVPAPANNWIPIGPSVVRRGQVSNQTCVAGRIARIAVAPRGSPVYAASGCGGVWRSDNAGETWTSTMEAWDLDPRLNAVISLSCGAIAIDPSGPDRVYVGTGEADNIVADNAGNIIWSGSFLGYGPLRSDDGGQIWHQENATPTLARHGFFALAVDPGNREHVIGATTNGIYRRQRDGADYHWRRVHSGVITSIVAARANNQTHFFAGRIGGSVLHSTDGINWLDAFSGFPPGAGRVGLAVQPANPNLVYALVARDYLGKQNSDNYRILGVWRLDDATVSGAAWRPVHGFPADVFGGPNRGQGNYDLAICVDLLDAGTIYLGGSTRDSGDQGHDKWSAALYRCSVQATGSGAQLSYKMTHSPIGTNVHADVHDLVFTPSTADHLWVCCDGGIFQCDDARTAATFRQRNVGLQTQTMEHLGQHPTEGAVLFCGSQDDGTLFYSGGADWLHMAPGDGGYAVVNWADPYRVLVTYPKTVVRQFADGASRYNYVDVILSTSDKALFYSPLVGTPMNASEPAQANRVAIGTTRPWISDTFGGNWRSIPSNSTSDILAPPNSTGDFRIRSMAFASHSMLYVGTMNGRIYRYIENDNGIQKFWGNPIRLDNLGGAHSLPANFALPVTDIVADRNDQTGNSIFVSFGGQASDYRRVWHFNGTQWTQRSGPGVPEAESLLDVQFNALVTDPDNPNHIYAGADIGVWQSTNGGSRWETIQEGLPDTSIFDLKLIRLDNGLRLLRASTHGRGVYERTLDNAAKRSVDLYVRTTQLDQGRFPAILGRPNPVSKGSTIGSRQSPDIKIDAPNSAGQYQFPPGVINFYQFADWIEDDHSNVATHEVETISNRVYIQVHNRGISSADKVQVTCLIADASNGTPELPAGYFNKIRGGDPINEAGWRTLGTVILDNVRVGLPRVAVLSLPSTMLPRPSQLGGTNVFVLAAFLNHAEDRYNSEILNCDENSINDRKTATKYFNVKEFTGVVPPYNAPVS